MSHGAPYDVAVVGFGPSGAVAAGLLGALGLRTYVCERSREVYDKPRAIALDHEIVRLFQQMGVLRAIEPHMEPFTDSVFYGVDGQAIKRMSTVPEPYPLAHTPSLVFSQPPVEKILRAHAASFQGVDVDLGQALTGLTQETAGVTLHLQSDAGQASTVRARHLIACDGASSTVRGLVGLALDDLGFDEPWLVVDVLVNDRGLARLPATSVQYCNPTRPATLVIGPGRHRRWEIAINPGEDPKQVATPEGTWALLAPWLSPQEGQLWRQASYRFHALVAQRWRAGHVFLAGDAAHQQPPFLGQGMCQGLRDVANLCWKLAAVIQGQARDALLDTYGEERKGHVTELTTRIKGIGQIVGERDPARARARDQRLLEDCGGVVQPTPRQDVQPALARGLLSRAPHAARGTLFPQPWLRVRGKSVRMDDVLGRGWRLVLSADADSGFELVAQAPMDQGLRVVRLGTPVFTEAHDVLTTWFRRHGVCAALVRPDHYVYGVASTPAELASQCADLSAMRAEAAISR
ncbi:MAG: hypothetical protein RL522_104 [Pseudomonadota bacterium]|jgi:3-(3-hydroxy-phenyl)propionate hydroxylase